MEKDSHNPPADERRLASIESFAQDIMKNVHGIDAAEAIRRATTFYNLTAEELEIIYGDLDKLTEQ